MVFGADNLAYMPTWNHLDKVRAPRLYRSLSAQSAWTKIQLLLLLASAAAVKFVKHRMTFESCLSVILLSHLFVAEFLVWFADFQCVRPDGSHSRRVSLSDRSLGYAGSVRQSELGSTY